MPALWPARCYNGVGSWNEVIVPHAFHATLALCNHALTHEQVSVPSAIRHGCGDATPKVQPIRSHCPMAYSMRTSCNRWFAGRSEMRSTAAIPEVGLMNLLPCRADMLYIAMPFFDRKLDIGVLFSLVVRQAGRWYADDHHILVARGMAKYPTTINHINS